MTESIFGRVTDEANKRLSDGILELARISAAMPQQGSVAVPLVSYLNVKRRVIGEAEIRPDGFVTANIEDNAGKDIYKYKQSRFDGSA